MSEKDAGESHGWDVSRGIALDDTLTPHELAVEKRVSQKTVYLWLRRKSNPLPHTRPGGRGMIRIERAAMERWFRGGSE